MIKRTLKFFYFFNSLIEFIILIWIGRRVWFYDTTNNMIPLNIKIILSFQFSLNFFNIWSLFFWMVHKPNTSLNKLFRISFNYNFILIKELINPWIITNSKSTCSKNTIKSVKSAPKARKFLGILTTFEENFEISPPPLPNSVTRGGLF